MQTVTTTTFSIAEGGACGQAMGKATHYPGEKERVSAWYIIADFTLIFARITAQYRPKPFISGAIENKS